MRETNKTIYNDIYVNNNNTVIKPTMLCTNFMCVYLYVLRVICLGACAKYHMCGEASGRLWMSFFKRSLSF